MLFFLTALAAGFTMAKQDCMSGTPLADYTGNYSPTIRSSSYLGGECKLGDFEVKQSLGSGNSGTVSFAIHSPSGRKVALKKIYAGNKDKFKSFRSEECTQNALSGNQFIASHYCTMVKDDYVYFVIEYSEGAKELRPMLRDGRGAKVLSNHQLKSIAVQLADATAYIQSMGIIYRDLKSANVLLSKDGRIKLIDFGMARYFSESGSKFREKPDVDWFLLGVHIYELATRGKVFSEDYSMRGGNRWKKLRMHFKCPKALSKDACDLVKLLILKGSKIYQTTSPSDRLSLIKFHPYFLH